MVADVNSWVGDERWLTSWMFNAHQNNNLVSWLETELPLQPGRYRELQYRTSSNARQSYAFANRAPLRWAPASASGKEN